MGVFDNFLLSNNDNYNKAKVGLKKVKKQLKCFAIAFPDVTPDEILFIKDKWELLPNSVAHGVRIMALGKDKGGAKSLLTDYRPNSYITPHRHTKEFEIGRIIKGELTNKLDGAVYTVGDEYFFTPEEIHYLTSSTGCLVHNVLTTNEDYVLPFLGEKYIHKPKIA